MLSNLTKLINKISFELGMHWFFARSFSTVLQQYDDLWCI